MEGWLAVAKEEGMPIPDQFEPGKTVIPEAKDATFGNDVGCS